MPTFREMAVNTVENTAIGMEKSLSDALERSMSQNKRMEEHLAQMDLMMENQGWLETGSFEDDGPDLDQIKESSKQIRNLMALNAHIKRGFTLRCNSIWEGGIQYKGIPGKRKGPGINVQERIDKPINQEYFFGPNARTQREGALFADSQVTYLGDDSDYTISVLDLREITAEYRNPDKPSEVWAYRRSWTPIDPNTGVPGEQRNEWYFRNLFWDRRVDTITANGQSQPVHPTRRVFGRPVNSLHGWAYGIADALPAVPWVRQYREMTLAGVTVAKAMAQIWAQVKVNSKNGGDNASVRLGGVSQNGYGQTAVTGSELQPLSTAGQGYDFSKAREILAIAATAMEVSTIALSSNSADAGSSYGAAATLSRPESLAIEARRQYHIELDKEVLTWMGAPDAEVWFKPLADWTELYREIQAIALLLNSGTYEGEDIKALFEQALGRLGLDTSVPDGFLLPNNEKSLALKTIDTDGLSAAGSTPSANQGVANGTGGAGSTAANDVRSDTIS